MTRCTACGNASPKPLVDGHAWFCPYVTDEFHHLFQYDANGAGLLVWQTPQRSANAGLCKGGLHPWPESQMVVSGRSGCRECALLRARRYKQRVRNGQRVTPPS